MRAPKVSGCSHWRLLVEFRLCSGEIINCKIVLDILEGQKRQGWVFNGRPQKGQQKRDKQQKKRISASRNKKKHHQQQQQEKHKQQAAQTAAQAAKTLWKVKRAEIGFSTVGDLRAPAAPTATVQQKQRKQQQRQQQQQQQQKQHEQQEK